MKAITQNISNVPASEMPRYAGMNFDRITDVLNGFVEFGANIRASITTVSFLTAGQVTAVPHTLGFTPQGYIVVKQDVAGSILTSEITNPWTSNTIYLNASVAMNATLIII